MKFKNWFIKEDILNWADFGNNKDHFNQHPDRSAEETEKQNKYSDPIISFNIEYLTEQLSVRKIGEKRGILRFVDEIVWGEGFGSLRLQIQPDFHVVLEKLGEDLMGEKVWFTKKIFIIDRSGFGGKEKLVMEELYDALLEVNEDPLDGPRSELDKYYFSNLVQHMASKMERVARPIFFLENIKRLNDYNYIIQFGVKGHGVGSPNQQRVEQNHTQVVYDKQRGIIRATNFNIESPVGKGHSWTIMPSDSDYCFSPTQNRDEIIQIFTTTMKYY